MTSQSENIFVTFDSKNQISTHISILATCAIALGMILGTSALIIWPICVLEGWRSDPMLTIMLVTAFVLVFGACHLLDMSDRERRSDRGKSL